jgi:hypothetical protein
MEDLATTAWVTGVVAVILAAVHQGAGRLRFLDVVPRSRWLSAAGGVSTAYVFVHILPELGRSQRQLTQALGSEKWFVAVEHHIFFIALLGLVLFYGLERAARRSRPREGGDGAEVFWIHLGSFAIYNIVIGFFLLDRTQKGWMSLALFSFAMGVHFVVNDSGLRHHYPRLYQKFGSWILSSAILVGWGMSLLFDVHPAAIPILFALLAGGIVLNVLKEELPDERESRFWAFALGALTYGLLLQLD